MTNDLEKLSLPELLERLSDISIPEPVSYAPNTVAWVWVITFIVAVLLIVGIQYVLRWRTNDYRRQAMSELKALEPKIGDSNLEIEREISTILRRTAMVASPRREVASLYGEDWLNYLNQRIGYSAFTNGVGWGLMISPYRPKSRLSAKDRLILLSLSRQWIQRHKRDDK